MSAPSLADRLARVALCRLAEPGDLRVASLVARAGAVETCELLRHPTPSAATESERAMLADVAQRLDAVDPATDLRRAARQGIRFVVPGDEEWPDQLTFFDHAEPVGGQGGAPLGLWLRGPLHLAETTQRAVAVVGARDATSYGGDLAVELGAGLARAGRTVVSGAAFGIDQAAHRGALGHRGPTVAVLACGVDRAYPTTHRELIDHIAATGLVVSELAPGCAPTRWRFLARNRIIAGLSLGTVVVEAAQRSGAANTASWTESLHRPVMGVPGPVTSAQSAGVHRLIRTRGATLVTRVEEVLEVLAPAGEHLLVEPGGEQRPHDGLGRQEQQVLDAVPVSRPVPTASIARTAGLALVSVSQALEHLVELGHVEQVGGGHRLKRHR